MIFDLNKLFPLKSNAKPLPYFCHLHKSCDRSSLQKIDNPHILISGYIFCYRMSIKNPSLFQLHSPEFGNSKLFTEKSSGWDIGWEQHWNHGRFISDFTFFSNTYSDLIAFDSLKYKNISGASTRGLEFHGLIQSGNNLSFQLNYTYTLATDHSLKGKGP